MPISTSEAFPERPDEERYSISPTDAALLTQRLLEHQPPEGEDRFVCYKVPGDSLYANVGRYVESVVFNEAFGNNPKIMEQEYGAYDTQSTFFISIDRDKGVPTGALRIIESGSAGLKTLKDVLKIHPETNTEEICASHQIDNIEKCWDVGTVAVMPENRSSEGGISVQLYRAVYVAAMEEGIEHFISIIDDKPLKKLTDYLGIPFEPLVDARPFEYLGSAKSNAVYGHVPDFYKQMNKGRLWRPKRILARNVLKRLVDGSQDSALQFDSRYKK
jgi:hypothetical protein